ncbi:hypothetical protein D0962_37630, partial [Leptolyngbyaceae cyanobacterium CCMR0082]
ADFDGLVLAANQELIFGQEITSIRLSAGEGILYNSQERPAQWFVSSHAGDDANDGMSAGSQFRTIGKLMEYFIAAGDTIIEDDDSYWWEELTVGDSIIVRRSNTGTNRPIHDAGDIADNSEFSLSAGQTNTYEIAWIPLHGNQSTDNQLTIYENGQLLRYRDTISDVDANPGSYTVDLFADVTGNILYVHPTGSSNPVTDGKQYIITRRATCITAGNNCTIIGIHTIRNVSNNGSIVALENALIEDCLVEYGTKHNLYANSATIRNCIIRYNDNYSHGSNTLLVFFKSNSTGLRSVVEGCTIEGGNPAIPDLPSETVALFMHSITVGGNLADSVIIRNCNITKVQGIGAGDVLSSTLENSTCINIGGWNMGNFTSIYRGNFIEVSGITPLPGRFDVRDNMLVEFRGNRIQHSHASNTRIFYIVGDNSRLTVVNNSFNRDTNNSAVIEDFGAHAGVEIVYTNNIAAGFARGLQLNDNAPASLSSENNIWKASQVFLLGANSYTGLANWQADPGGYDQNSVEVDPGFIDPANGDFTTAAPEVDTLQAGVEY